MGEDSTQYTWIDPSGNEHRLNHHDTRFTTLIYHDKIEGSDEKGERHVIQLPAVTDITFSQDVGLPSRPTITGDFRQQFTRRKVPTITFSIKLAKRMNEDLNSLFAEGKIIKTFNWDTDSIIDLETAFSNIGYTSAQFITLLEELKLNNTVFSLSTSSPLNNELYDLVINNISYKHSAESREIVACTVTCNRIQLVDIDWEIADKLEILGFISEELDEVAKVIPRDYRTVYADGLEKFSPVPLGTIDRLMNRYKLYNFMGQKIIDFLGVDEPPLFYMASDEIIFTSAADQVYNLKFGANSTYLIESQMYSIGDQVPMYLIRLLDLQIKATRKSGGIQMRPVTWGNLHNMHKGFEMPEDYTALNRDADMYDIANTYGHLNIGLNADNLINPTEFAGALHGQDYTKEFDSATQPIPPRNNSQIIKDTKGFIYANRLREQYEFEVNYKKDTDDNWINIMSTQSLLGGFKIYYLPIKINPTFEGWTKDTKAELPDFNEAVVNEWKNRVLPDPVTVHTFIHSVGNRMKVHIFCPDIFGNSNDANARRVEI